jgi:hypothetical protein
LLLTWAAGQRLAPGVCWVLLGLLPLLLVLFGLQATLLLLAALTVAEP